MSVDPLAECGGDGKQCVCPKGPLQHCLINDWIGEQENARHTTRHC